MPLRQNAPRALDEFTPAQPVFVTRLAPQQQIVFVQQRQLVQKAADLLSDEARERERILQLALPQIEKDSVSPPRPVGCLDLASRAGGNALARTPPHRRKTQMCC